MSNPKPQPLWELVKEFHKIADDDYAMIDNSEDSANDTALGRGSAGHRCAHELAAALRAWDEQLEKEHGDPGYPQWFNGVLEARKVRQAILGVPAKEPAQKDREVIR